MNWLLQEPLDPGRYGLSVKGVCEREREGAREGWGRKGEGCEGEGRRVRVIVRVWVRAHPGGCNGGMPMSPLHLGPEGWRESKQLISRAPTPTQKSTMNCLDQQSRRTTNDLPRHNCRTSPPLLNCRTSPPLLNCRTSTPLLNRRTSTPLLNCRTYRALLNCHTSPPLLNCRTSPPLLRLF